MKQNLNRNEEQEKLQQFIFEIDDILEKFIDDLAEKGYNLDYSFESMNVLERFMLDENITNTDKDLDVRTDCWIYLGEFFRKVTKKGKWEISMNDENTINYGLYVIANYNDKGTEFVPMRYIKAFILKKKLGLLKSVIINHINPKMINLDDIPTEE